MVANGKKKKMVKRTGWDGVGGGELVGGYWEGEMTILLGFKQTPSECRFSVLIAPHGYGRHSALSSFLLTRSSYKMSMRTEVTTWVSKGEFSFL